jgi:hypothetical protein
MELNNREELWVCKNCNCEFMEKVSVALHPDNHSVIPTQSVPTLGETYYFYRCLSCGALNEPRVTRLSRDSFDRDYQFHLDQLAEKGIKVF